HRTKLHPSVTLAVLLNITMSEGTAHDTSCHQLSLSAFMRASKVICDSTYSNKLRSIVDRGMFQPREINQMVRVMCQYLE
ncbi:hypothetical protein BU15DRAFT_15701, partial [Melanogaster broomeanus]